MSHGDSRRPVPARSREQLHHLQFIIWPHGRNLRTTTAVTFKSNWKHHALIDMVVADPLQVYALIIVLSSPREVLACEGLNASFEQAWRLYTVQARQHIATTFRVIPFGFRKRRLSLLHWSTSIPGLVIPCMFLVDGRGQMYALTELVMVLGGRRRLRYLPFDRTVEESSKDHTLSFHLGD